MSALCHKTQCRHLFFPLKFDPNDLSAIFNHQGFSILLTLTSHLFFSLSLTSPVTLPVLLINARPNHFPFIIFHFSLIKGGAFSTDSKKWLKSNFFLFDFFCIRFLTVLHRLSWVWSNSTQFLNSDLKMLAKFSTVFARSARKIRVNLKYFLLDKRKNGCRIQT